MKKIIFILALFFSFVANAQYTPPTGYTNINSRYDWLAGVFRALGLPAGGNAAFTAGQAQRAGSVYYDSTGADAGLYIWDGSAWVGVQYTDADARAAISLTTTGTSGAATYTSATGVFNTPDYTTTSSQGITKTGSDFTLEGNYTSDRVLTGGSHSTFTLRSGATGIAFQTINTDTITAPNDPNSIGSVGFSAIRNLHYPAYSTLGFRGGNATTLNYLITDSAQMTTYGGDAAFANKTGMTLGKMSGYSGRSVYMAGSAGTLGEGVPIQLNDLTLQHSTSTTSNYRYAKNYWIGSQSYLVIGVNDTLENWVGFNNMGFVNGGKVKYSVDYAGGYFGSGYADKAWFLYNYGDNSNSYHKAAFYIGDSTLTPSALLNVSSTTRGVVWPRMTTVQKDAIASPATGLIVFDTDLVQYNFWDGDSWEAMGGGGATPTLQQVLTAGSILTTTNSITTTGFPFSIQSNSGGTNSWIITDSTNEMEMNRGAMTNYFSQTAPAGIAKTIIRTAGMDGVDSTESEIELNGSTITFKGGYQATPEYMYFNSLGLQVNKLAGTGNRLVYSNDQGVLGNIKLGTGVSISNDTLYGTGGGSGFVWGDGTGTLSDQTDLQSALDAKQNLLVNSAGLATALSDETGTGLSVFNTTPTFTTNITTPVIIGGTASGNSLTYSSTSHATKGSHIFGTTNGMVFDEAATKLMLNGQTATGQLNLKTAAGGIGMFIRNTTDADIALLINSAAANQHVFYGNGNADLSKGGGYTQIGSFTTAGVKLSVGGTSTHPGGAFFKGFTDADAAFAINNAASTLNETKFYSNGSADIGIQGGNTLKVGGKTFIGAISTPTALLHIGASAAGASAGSVKINEGSRQTTPEDGTLNYVANNLEFTETSTVYTLAKTLTNTATLDFDLTAVNYEDLTITVTGAADGDAVIVGAPNGAVVADVTFFGWVSGANTVTVRCSRVGGGAAANPASGTYRASVVKY